MKPLKTAGAFKQVPAGPHPAVLYALIDLGTQEGTYQGKPSKPKRKVRLTWELHGEGCQLDDGRPMTISKTFTLSSSSKGTLRPFMEAWRTKAFTDDEFEDFDLANMLGKPCILTIVEDGDYMTINGVTKLMMGMSPPEQVNNNTYLSLDEFDPAVFARLHEKTRETIEKSPEYRIATGQAPASTALGASADAPFDDEIPF